MDKLLIYLIVVNVVTFICYGVDKYKSIRKSNRISERALFCLSFIGGVIGSLCGMKVFRHKTLKLRFYVCNTISVLVWIYIFLFCL